MDFIKLETELPPANYLVLIKRRKGPLFLGFRRREMPLATNPDPSQDTYWRGAPIDDLGTKDVEGGFCNSSFSDVTVEGWKYVSAE